MSFLIPALIGAGSAYLSSASQRKASNQAGDVAQGLSQEQMAILRQILQNMQQYGGPLLERGWEYASKPGETAMDRNQYARGLENINTQFRPAYANLQQGLSNRGLIGSPNTFGASATSAMDRARAGALGDFTMDWRSNMVGQQGERLGQFGDLLAQLTGGQTGAAGAYNQPISTYAGLASGGAGGTQDLLSALINMYGLSKLKGAGSTGPGVGGYGAIEKQWSNPYPAAPTL